MKKIKMNATKLQLNKDKMFRLSPANMNNVAGGMPVSASCDCPIPGTKLNCWYSAKFTACNICDSNACTAF